LQGLSESEEEVTRDVDLEGFVVSGLQDCPVQHSVETIFNSNSK